MAPIARIRLAAFRAESAVVSQGSFFSREMLQALKTRDDYYDNLRVRMQEEPELYYGNKA